MSKLSMRARKLDNSRQLRVYRAEDIPDLEEQSQYGRGVMQIATGVEKEEEEEHHLQAVISASQVDAPNAKDIFIPIPDASTKVNHYAQLYKQTFNLPANLFRGQNDVSFMDDYDMDDEDYEWLQKVNKPSKKVTEDQFENLFCQFEQQAKDYKDSKDLPATLDEFGSVTSSVHASILSQLYTFWRSKRQPLKCGSLLYPLKPETVSNDPDPYVCFRRRELRPLRKTRRNDQQAYEKMLKLRNEMERAKALMELVKKRDRLKKESVSLDFLIFEQKAKIWDLRRLYQIPSAVENESQATELKKPPKPKPKQPPPPPKIRLNINGGVVKTVSTDAPSSSEENIINIPTPPLNPTALDEQELQDARFLERQLAGIDPIQTSVPSIDSLHDELSEDLGLSRPMSDYEDLTDMKVFGLPAPFRKRKLEYQTFSEGQAPIPRGRRRIGRGGRVIFDRPSSSVLPKGRYNFGYSDSEDEELDLTTDVPRSFVSVPLPFYTLNELSILNGTSTVNKAKAAPPPIRRLGEFSSLPNGSTSHPFGPGGPTASLSSPSPTPSSSSSSSSNSSVIQQQLQHPGSFPSAPSQAGLQFIPTPFDHGPRLISQRS